MTIRRRRRDTDPDFRTKRSLTPWLDEFEHRAGLLPDDRPERSMPAPTVFDVYFADVAMKHHGIDAADMFDWEEEEP
jgi:hypothetical protein